MEFIGKLVSVVREWKSGKINITFSAQHTPSESEIEFLQDKELRIKATKYYKHRSLDANALLWACIEEIAAKLIQDKWNVYLMMLRRYGRYTYIAAKPSAVEAIKAQWREAEEIGEVYVNGQKAVEMLCYFGSSTYNTHEFSILLEGVLQEMDDLGIPRPPSDDMQRALQLWEKREVQNG